jgi:hypothetical protein
MSKQNQRRQNASQHWGGIRMNATKMTAQKRPQGSGVSALEIPSRAWCRLKTFNSGLANGAPVEGATSYSLRIRGLYPLSSHIDREGGTRCNPRSSHPDRQRESNLTLELVMAHEYPFGQAVI